jgi:hypothetical protein
MLPTCQHCQQSGRVCKGLQGRTGLWGNSSTSAQTLAPNNTSPAANTRAIAANAQCGRSSDSENRQRIEHTWVENSTANTVRGHIPLEPGASGPAFMVGMDHSKLSSNPPKQTASEGDLADGANRESSKKPRTGKVINTPPFIFDVC